MNIVAVSDFLYPDSVGGSWNYAHDIAQRLAARGHRCWGISAHPGDDRPFEEQVGAVVFHRYPLRRGNHLISFASRVIGALGAMQRIARRHSIDILHTHAPMGAVGALLAPVARAVPRVATVHGTGVLPEYLCELAALGGEGSLRSCSGLWALGSGLGRRQLSSRAACPFPTESPEPRAQSRAGGASVVAYCAAIDRVERWYLRQAQRAHALSRFSRDAFAGQHRMDPARIAIIPPGVDLDRFRPGPRDVARRRLGLPEERPILFTVRRLTARMGLDLLLHAVRLAALRRPDLLLLIGGKGPMRPQLERMIADQDLERNVALCGFIPDDQLPLYYQAADLFVLPSIASEGFGLITLEALACDLPVLGTPMGGTVELLNAIDPTLLFPDTGAEAMAAHIDAWLEKERSPSPSYRARVAEAFNWETCLDRIEALFAEARGT